MMKFINPTAYVLAPAALLSAALLSASVFATALPALADDKAPIQLVSNDTSKASTCPAAHSFEKRTRSNAT